MRDPRGADGRDAAAPEALTRLARARAAHRDPAAPAQPRAVARLVRGGLGEDMGDEICAACARATGGNPLLARQLITALGQRGVEPASLDAGAVAAMGPPSVARFVAARLRRRAPEVAAVARALAILGDDASLADTAEVAGVDRETAASAVDELIAAELLHPDAAAAVRAPDRPVRRSRTSLPPAEQAQLHLAAARALARDPARCERAAVHLLATGARRRALGVRRADRGGAARRRPRRRRPGRALPAPRARGAGAGPAAPRRAVRARRGRGGRAPARGGRPHGGGAAPLEHPGGDRAGGARALDGALPGRRAARGGRRLRGRARRGRRARPRAAARARVPGGRHAPRRRAAERRDVRPAAGARAGGAARRDGGRAQPARPDRARVRGDDGAAGDRRRRARRGGLGRRAGCSSRCARSTRRSRRRRR